MPRKEVMCEAPTGCKFRGMIKCYKCGRKFCAKHEQKVAHQCAVVQSV